MIPGDETGPCQAPSGCACRPVQRLPERPAGVERRRCPRCWPFAAEPIASIYWRACSTRPRRRSRLPRRCSCSSMGSLPGCATGSRRKAVAPARSTSRRSSSKSASRRRVDLSVQTTYRNGEFWRDPSGQAHVERIETTRSRSRMASGAARALRRALQDPRQRSRFREGRPRRRAPVHARARLRAWLEAKGRLHRIERIPRCSHGATVVAWLSPKPPKTPP